MQAAEPLGFVNQRGLCFPVMVLSKLIGTTSYMALLKKLTVVHRPKQGPPVVAKMYKLYDEDAVKWIRLPRAVCAAFVAHTRAVFASPAIIPPRLQLELFPNQVLCVDRLMQIFTPERIAAGTACAELVLGAGKGKTFVAAGVITRLSLRTLYIVPKDVLAIQAVEDLQGCLLATDRTEAALHPIRIGQFGREKKKDPSSFVANQDVTVILIHSALLQPPEFFAGYGLVIIDEVHTTCSNEWRKIWHKAHCAVTLGMTATPTQRTDGMDPIAQKEIVCASDGIVFAEKLPGWHHDDFKFTSRVTVIRYCGPPQYTRTLKHESTDSVFCSYMHRQFLSDPYRLYIAVQAVRALYDWRGTQGQQHCIYIFCEELALLQILYQAFRDSFGDDIVAPEIGNEVGNFVGGIKTDAVNDIKDNARILLTTYGYGGTGVSILKMTAIVKLTPRRANMQQIDARILRRGGDASIERRIIDIHDYKSCLKGQLSSRMQSYEHYGMEVEVKRVDWEDIARALGEAVADDGEEEKLYADDAQMDDV
jgi:Type III restriction enzyme, res subunit